jgi:hypothetical protein
VPADDAASKFTGGTIGVSPDLANPSPVRSDATPRSPPAVSTSPDEDVVLDPKSLHFLKLIPATTSPVPFRQGDRNEETCNKKPCGKGKKERNESLNESGVTHILHLLKTSSINYGDQENSVSPRLNFYLNSFGVCGKVFWKQNYTP